MLANTRAHLFGVLCMFISALSFSTKAIFAKLAYVYGVDAVTLVALRMAFAAPFFAAILVWQQRRRPLTLSRPEHGRIWLMGIAGFYLASVLDFWGLEFVSAGLERTILYSYPTIVTVINFLWFGKTPTQKQVTALVLTYVGLAIASYSELGSDYKATAIGSAFVFGSSVTYAIYLVGSSSIIPRVGALAYASYASLVSTVAIVIHSFLARPIAPFEQQSQVYVLALMMAIVATVVPVLLLGMALGAVGANTASIIGAIGPISTIGLAMIFLGEQVTARQTVGIAIVITGVLLVSFKSQEKPGPVG
jgi:drug/metabolite transporter (DMT)-like permease